MDESLQQSKSKIVSSVIIEKPLKGLVTLKAEREDGDVVNKVVDKLQNCAINNGEPRCSNNELPNVVAYNSLNSINDAGDGCNDNAVNVDVNATTAATDRTQMHIVGSSVIYVNGTAVATDRPQILNFGSNVIYVDATTAATDRTQMQNVVSNGLTNDNGSNVPDESNEADPSYSDDSNDEWEDYDSSDEHTPSHIGTEGDSDGSDFTPYDDDEQVEDDDEEEIMSIESFELNDSIREAMWNHMVERNTVAFKFQSRASVTEDAIDVCPVCLLSFVDEDSVRRLPCFHLFHTQCVDEWLKKHKKICPSCRMHINNTADYLNESGLQGH